MTADDARTPSACYQYIRDQYGLTFRVGDAVLVDGGKRGIVRPKRTRLHYVSVLVEGEREAGEYHPGDVTADQERA